MKHKRKGKEFSLCASECKYLRQSQRYEKDKKHASNLTGKNVTLTRLILRTLAQLDLAGKHIIDAGTGTGILSIMAVKRGAESVFAYDIDEWSVENTKDNLLLNHIYNNVEVEVGDSSVLEGQEKADLLIANINRNILLQDLPRFAKALVA